LAGHGAGDVRPTPVVPLIRHGNARTEYRPGALPLQFQRMDRE
jgi:hypothetical protein